MDIVEELYSEIKELDSIEREVQERISQATEAGEIIDEEVSKWLEKAHNISVKVKTNSVEGVLTKSTLCNRLISCYACSKKPNEDALKIKASIEDLVAEGQNIFSAKGIELVQRDGFVDFRSRKATMARIMEGLKDDDIGIVGISGLGGIGKTMLVTEIGTKAKDEKLFDQVLMATVSQHPDIIKIQATLADMLDLKLEHDDEAGRANELQTRLEKKSKVLVIMDDVWEVIKMETIGVSPYSNKKGCKIIVTTRLEKVCNDMCCDLVVRLDVISGDDAWNLFKEHADLLKDKKSNRFLAKAKNIVKECGGLPLAIVVVGSALRGKDFEDYNEAFERLSNSNFVNIESADREIYSCLKFSYDYLEDEDTKKCFLLCSIFPEDSRIFVKELTRYAYGQWLYQNVNSVDEARKKIFASVEKLEDAYLLSRVTRLSINRKGDYFQTWPIVKMHDMVRDFALWIARGNGDFFFVLTPSNKLQKKRTYEDATAFYLTKYQLDWQFPNKLVCPNLKILIISSHLPLSLFEFVPENFFEVTSALRVLDVHKHTPAGTVSPLILIENLLNLKSLRLDGNLLLRDRDTSMLGKLKNLEILELNIGSQRLFPEWIGKLCNLRLLDLSRWWYLEVIPCNLLVNLVKLEELYTPHFHIPDNRSQWDANFLSYLKFLPNLMVFTGTFRGFQSLPGDSWFSNLQRYYINCRTFKLNDEEIRWTRCLGLDDVNELSMKMFQQLLPGVECLKIAGQQYIGGVQNICPQIDNAGFQNLRELHLECFSDLECIIDTTGSGLGLPSPITVFPKLVLLTLVSIRQLCKMCHGELPSSCLAELRRSEVWKCHRLKNIIPDMLPIGSKMEEIDVWGCIRLKCVYDLVKEQSFQDTKYDVQSIPCPRLIELSDLPQVERIWNVASELEVMEGHIDVELCKLIIRCLDSLVKMKVHKCVELEEVFPVVELNSNQKAGVLLSNLVELDLQSLPKLRCIWKGHHQNCSLQNLERIEVVECDTLTSIFSSTLSQGLEKLQYLVVKECRALETIIMLDDEDQAMKGLYPATLGKSFQEMKEITIKSCDKLNTIFPMCFVAQGLPKLESIVIEDCAELEQLFVDHVEENVANGDPFSNLTELYLRLLPKLKCIWSSRQRNCGLQNLKHIELKECHTLTRLFTSSFAQNLQQLQYLTIGKCQELEMIITQDEAMRGPYSSRSQNCFQEIKMIEIISCDKLKTVLPVSFVAQGLPKLESILIVDCAKLQQVFGDHGEENVSEGEHVMMNNLKQLTLQELPSLVRLSPLKCDISASPLSMTVDDGLLDLLNLL